MEIIFNTKEEVELRSILSEEIGIEPESIGLNSIDYAVKNLMNASGLDSLSNYIKLIKYQKEELNKLIEDIVVPETWFFRDKEPFNLLKNYIKNYYYNKAYPDKLRILSMPCSTGEEPYSIAMTLLEMGVSPDKFHIDAIDISSRVIEIAKAAVYKKISFRDNNYDIIKKYFIDEENGYKLIDSISKLVNFYNDNIIKDDFLSNKRKYNIIFCKNILIYLNETSRQLALKNINRLLKSDGLLFVGHTEVTYFIHNGFVSVDHSGSFACKKNIPIKQNPEQKYELNKPEIRSIPKDTYLIKKIENLSITKTIKESTNEQISEDIVTSNKEKIKSLADSGNFQEALDLCEQLIKTSKSDYELYYLAAIIKDINNNYIEAESYYQKSLYLNPNNYEALIHLSLLYEKNGFIEKSIIFKERAKRVHDNNLTT